MDDINRAIAVPADRSPIQPLANMEPPREAMLVVEPVTDARLFMPNAVSYALFVRILRLTA